MRDQSIDPSRIQWVGNGPKREADQMLYRTSAMDIMRMAQQGKIDVLSLPGPTWMWELGLVDAFPHAKFRFEGLERDTKVFKKLEKAASGLGAIYKMTKTPESFYDFAARRDFRSKQFGIIYLDWMGTWSREKKGDLDVLFQSNMLKVGGLLIMTVSLRRGRPETNDELQDLSYDLPLAFYDARGEDKYVSNMKVRGIPHWVADMASEKHQAEMRPIMACVYYSKTGISDQTQPQLQIVMLRES